jgi:ATP-dependent DNA helicase RecQ
VTGNAGEERIQDPLPVDPTTEGQRRERVVTMQPVLIEPLVDEREAVTSPVVVARQILSCVARVGQRLGATHVANVLRGHASDPVLARGHEKLSTFGLLPAASVVEIRGYIEQLTGLGLLQQIGDEYPVLALTPSGVALLKDEHSCPDLTLARQRPARKDKTRAPSRIEAESWHVSIAIWFERCAKPPTSRAPGASRPTSSSTTRRHEMARLRPTSISSLLDVKGVGARKADDLGELFLAAIRGHATP